MIKNILFKLFTIYLFLTVSNSFSQEIIFSEDFEGFSQDGALGTSPVGVNGWRSSANAGYDVNNWGAYRNIYQPGSGGVGPIYNYGHAIDGRSLMIAATEHQSLGAGQHPGLYFSNLTTNKYAYVTVNATGYTNITLEFQWKCYGDLFSGQLYDYGMVTYNAGSGWQNITSGGTYGNGRYGAGDSNVRTAIVTFPASVNNKSFQFGFRWINDNVDAMYPGFVIDNIIVRGTPISSDRTLTVSNAYTGASHANGSHTIPNNTNLTVTSGTRPGYEILGWTGTGSVPPSGTGGTVSFPITENSSITWNWEAIKPQFHNYGGSEQLAFNNSKINTANPIFRLSHQGGTATGYQIQISPDPNFSTGVISQTFSGSFPADTENNFEFTSGSSFTSGTTYYVRAAVDLGAGFLSDGWTTETYSFTYQNDQEIPSWFQTTQAQFESDELVGVNANASHNVVTGAGGNMIVNGDFSNGTTGWTVTGHNGEGKVVAVYANPHPGFSGNWLGMGSGSTIFQPASGTIVVSQEIDLTNVSQITFNAGSYNYVSCCSDPNPNTKAEFKIGGTLTDTNGTVRATLVQNTSPTRQDKTVDVSSYTGVHVIKFVMTYNSYWNGNGVTRFYFADVKAEAPPSGTITSTPIHFASVQDAVSYGTFEWNQTPGSGSLKFDIQGSFDGENFSNIPGYTNIEESGTGIHSIDIFDIDPITYPHLRLVGKLDGVDATLHDWSVTFKREGCNASTTWTGTGWSNGIPSDLSTKIIISGDFTSDDTNTNSGELIGCSMEVVSGNVIISSEHSVTLENEIKIADTASFTLENNAHLVQISPTAENDGIITVKRISAPMIRQDATGWSSPVANQNLRNFSPGTLKKRYYIYNGYGPEGSTGSNFKAIFEYDPLYPMPSSIPNEWPGDKLPSNNLFDEVNYTFQKGWGYAIRVPNNWSNSTPLSFNAVFVGEPHNGDVEVPAYGKYTLVGNPYPSAIDANKFLLVNSDIAALHFWTHHFPVGNPNYNNNYVTYTSLGSAGQYPENAGPQPNGKIALAQAFVVEHGEIEDEEGNDPWPVVFNNSMRTHDFAYFYKTDFLERHRFWLSLANSNEEKTAQILVGYMTGATQEADHQIDGKRMGTAPLYSLIDGEKYTVQGRALPFDQEDVVPLGFTADESGKFKIQIDRVDGLFAETENSISIYLRDRLKGIEHNLSNSPYEFESSEGEFLERFEIFYKTDETLSVEDEWENNSILIYQNSQNIVIQSKTEKILSVELWDLSGRKIHQNLQVNAQVYEMKRKNFDTLILLVKVLTQDGKITTRKIIHSKN